MSGVGTELKKLISVFGDWSGCTNCTEKAALLDENGPGWASDNLDTVVRWVVDNSKVMYVSRLIPEPIKVEIAKRLVLEAIESAQKNKI